MKNKQQLIQNVIGQLQGISGMIDEGKDCFAVLTQLKAASSALNSLTVKYLEENFISCFKECRSPNEEMCHKFFSEITKHIS